MGSIEFYGQYGRWLFSDSFPWAALAGNRLYKQLAVIGTSATLAIGCAGRMPTAASPRNMTTGRPRWILSGQSNAVRLAPFLRAHADVSGYFEGGLPIREWRPEGKAWPLLLPSLQTRADAFIWFQGESDLGFPEGYYRESLKDLIARVRAQVGDPAFFVVVIEVTPSTSYEPIRREQAAYVSTDSHSMIFSVEGLPFSDELHLADDGYQELARRLAIILSPPMGHSKRATVVQN